MNWDKADRGIENGLFDMLRAGSCHEHHPFSKLEKIFTDWHNNPAGLVEFDKWERAVEAKNEDMLFKELSKMVVFLDKEIDSLSGSCEKCKADLNIMLSILKSCEIKAKMMKKSEDEALRGLR